ncbi:MAG: ankyrin repeat domain-containing protein [Candidatus Binatia bacterium]
MYNDFFGFRERPFSVTPDPRVYYSTPTYQKIYNNLVYGVREGKSLCVMTGEVGTGKTTMLRRIMKDLDASCHFAYFTYTTLAFDDLLDFLCEDLGLPPQEGGNFQKLKALQKFLSHCQSEGRPAALLIDEAQNLTEPVLEEIRHLLNLTDDDKSLLPVVLVGQPELERKLSQPSVYQLKQRISLHCQLDRLKDREVTPFIFHRLQAIGYEGQDLFTPEALERITFYVQGIPRLINIVCDNALLLAYSLSQKTVSAEMIEEVSQDLGLLKNNIIEQERLSPIAVEGDEREKQDAMGSPPLHEERLRDPLPLPHARASSRAHFHVITPMGASQPAKNKRPTANSTIVEWVPRTVHRRSSRRLAWAGTGLAFALWSFTLLPYGENEESFLSPVAPTQNTRPDDLSGQTMTFLARNEINALIQQQSNPQRNQQFLKDQTRGSEKRGPAGEFFSKNQPEEGTGRATFNANVPGTDNNRLTEEEDPTQAGTPLPNAPLLIEAAAKGDTERGQLLLREGIAPDMVDERGWTALMMAALHGHTPMAKLLLQKGANQDARNSTGGTALMMAAIQGHRDTLQLLLTHGAKVNLQDAKGWTALMYAARNGHTSIVQSLLAAGANPRLKNDEGWTAAMYATNRGHQETVHALLNGSVKTTNHN